MNIIWGLIIAAVGTLFITLGRAKSDFGPYRLLVARSCQRGDYNPSP